MPTSAVQIVRRMRGHSHSHLVLGADGRLWVVKFRNNPQGERTLANEMIATRIAASLGLTVPETDAIEVTDWLMPRSQDTHIKGRSKAVRNGSGIHFGSLYVGGLMPGQVVDYMPGKLLSEVRNLQEFAGILCADIWTCNADSRQAVFSRTQNQRQYVATFIDQGSCFGSKEWSFSDEPSRGVYPRKIVYQDVTGWDSFEPWLSKLEALEADTLIKMADDVPQEWYGGQTSQLRQLIDRLWARRCKVRGLIKAFRNSDEQPFPNWKQVAYFVAPEIPQPSSDGPPFPSWKQVAQALAPDPPQNDVGTSVLPHNSLA